MSSKLNLEVGRGNGFNEQNRFAIKFDIKNYDTSAVALSGLRVVAYSWLQYRNILSQFTSGTNSQGMLSQFVSATDSSNGVGQTGIVNLNQSQTTYRVYHNVINSSKIAPQLTLNAPNGSNSFSTVVSYANSTDTYFDIVLNDVMPLPGYSVTWFIPGTYDEYTGSTTNIGSPTLTIEKVSEYIRVKNRKYDSRFIFAWNGNSNLINPGWGLKDTDVYVQLNPTLFPSSNITSSWYSSLTDAVLEDNPYFVLEQWNGSSWQTVQEYLTSGTLDNLTGTLSTDLNFVKIVNNGTGNNKSTYISVSGSNPISANASDKNNLSLWSKSNIDKRRRSLIKFETSAIPSSATGIKNAVLRLNVNSLTNAWNYYSTNGHVSVHRITSDWNENEATWANRKFGIPWTTSGGDYDATPAIWIGSSELSNSFTSADQNKQFWLDFDITSIVDYWRLNPSQNYGLLVKLYDSGNENNSSDIRWELNSGRLSGSGSISGFPQLLVSYNSLNVSGAIPTIEINEPSDNSNIYESTFSISGTSNISSGLVESVSAYYREKSSVLPYKFLGTLTNNGINTWVNSFSSLSEGSYEFILRAISDLGDYGESSSISVTFNKTPELTYTTNSTCHGGVINLNGTIEVTNSTPIGGSVSYSKQFIPTDKKITSIIEDRITSGIVWVATAGNGLYRIDKGSVSNRVVSFKTDNSSIAYDTINDIAMDSQGILWISYSGNGVGLFDSKNWATANSNDWYLYNSSNSSLSAYPANSIDICDINVDANDNKWFSLTYQTNYSIIKLSGYSFNDTYSTKYNINAMPRKIATRGSYTYVATNDNRLFKFDGITWNNYALPTFKNINDISIDTLDTVWLATDSGFASFAGTTFTELSPSATLNWPNGLNSGNEQKINPKSVSVYIDGNNYKWFSFSTGSNSEYNGGVVKYNRNVIDSIGISSNISVFDKKNYSGMLSNNVLRTIYTSANDSLWVATDSGLSVLTYNTWDIISLDSKSYPISISGANWSSNIVPLYGNQKYDITFDYANGTSFTSSVDISSSQTPSITINYPTVGFSPKNSNTVSKLIDYVVDCLDVYSGAGVSVVIQKAPTSNGPWTSILGFTNAFSYPIYDYVYPEDLYYLKVIATNGSCSAESDAYAIYGSSECITTINPLSGTNFTNTPISFYGNVYSQDFSRVINANGNTYVDSLESVEFGYVTSAGFNSIGFATLTSVVNSSANFYFEWPSPIAGVSALSAISLTKYGTSSVGYVTFNSVASKPSITILTPTNNQYISLNSNFVLSASTTYLSTPVSALNFYISNAAGTSSIGSATSAGNNIWTKSFSPSSYGSGKYNISATCKDTLNVSAGSNSTPFNINYLPSIIQVSDLSATHNGTYYFQFNVSDVEGFYGNRVEIISAGSVYTSGTVNGFGEFVWNWVNPPNGSIPLSAKIYDGNPATSSDFVIYPFVLNLNKLSVSINSFIYPSGKLNSVAISPKVNVVTTNTLITPTLTISGTNVSATKYWLCNYDFSTSSYYKQSILSGTSFKLPSSREFISQNQSRYHFWGVVAELISTNGSSVESAPAYFYVKEQSISGDISNSVCQNPITLSGTLLDSDLPYYSTNTIIDTSVSAIIYNETSGTYLGTLSQGNRNDENIPLTYSWSNPSSSVSAVSLRVIDSYGISATQIINYGGLETQPQVTLVSGVSSIASLYGSIFLVSAGTYQISATTSATKIKDLHFEYLLNDVWYTTSANINKVATVNIPVTSGSFAIHAYLKTSGNCVAQSDEQIFITLAPISGNIYPDNCSMCYCNGGRLKITGYLNDINFQNDYLTRSFGRSISAYLYDDSNNLISDITSQVSNGNGSFETYWENPTAGTNSIYLKVVDNYGVVQTINKQLARTIYSSPSLNLLSPIDYSISGTIYRQDNAISFASLVSSTDLLGVKYYINDELKATTNASNGFLYEWNDDKLPGLYSISAVAINSNGCYSIVTRNVMVSNSPVTNFIYPVSGNYYQTGTLLSATIDSKGNSPATVSAVSVKFAGSSFNTIYNQNTRYWETSLSAISSVSSVYPISAYSYDTLGQVTIKEIKIKVSNSPIFSATVSGTSAVSANYNTLLPLNVSGYSVNGGYLTSCYVTVNGNIIKIPNVSSNVFYSEILIPLYLTSGSNTLSVNVIDSVGAISSRSVFVYVNPFTGVISYPVIKNVGSSPMNKVTYRS